MGVASLVLGIISIIIGLVPFCGIIALVPAIVGFILGIVDTVSKSKKHLPKGMSIAGLILSIIAIIFIIGYFVLVGLGTAIFSTASDEISDARNAMNSINEQIAESLSNYTCYVGGSATVDDIKVTFTSVDQNFTDYSSYATVKSGYKIIKADFEFENMDTTSSYVSSYDFDCYADDVSCSAFYYVEDSSFSTSLDAGRKAKGSVYFEVPAYADDIEIVYDGNIWTDEKVTFIVK